MNESEILQGIRGLMVLKTIAAIGPLHGHGIAPDIEISEEALPINQGTILRLCGMPDAKGLDFRPPRPRRTTTEKPNFSASQEPGVNNSMRKPRIGSVFQP